METSAASYALSLLPFEEFFPFAAAPVRDGSSGSRRSRSRSGGNGNGNSRGSGGAVISADNDKASVFFFFPSRGSSSRNNLPLPFFGHLGPPHGRRRPLDPPPPLPPPPPPLLFFLLPLLQGRDDGAHLDRAPPDLVVSPKPHLVRVHQHEVDGLVLWVADQQGAELLVPAGAVVVWDRAGPAPVAQQLPLLAAFFSFVSFLLFPPSSPSRAHFNVAVRGGEQVHAGHARGLLNRHEQHPSGPVEPQRRFLPTSSGQVEHKPAREHEGTDHKVSQHRRQEGLQPRQQGDVPAVEREVEAELREVDETESDLRDERQLPLQRAELQPEPCRGRDGFHAGAELEGPGDGPGDRGEEQLGEERGGARGGAERGEARSEGRRLTTSSIAFFFFVKERSFSKRKSAFRSVSARRRHRGKRERRRKKRNEGKRR